MKITSSKIALLAVVILAVGCAKRDGVKGKDILDPSNREYVVVYEGLYDSLYDANFEDEIKVAKLADEYHLRGAIASVRRVPTEAEFDLIRSAILSCGSEMNDDETGKLFFLKTSAGLTVQPKDTPPFTLTGKSTGYRIIYGPNPSSVHDFRAQGLDYNFGASGFRVGRIARSGGQRCHNPVCTIAISISKSLASRHRGR